MLFPTTLMFSSVTVLLEPVRSTRLDAKGVGFESSVADDGLPIPNEADSVVVVGDHSVRNDRGGTLEQINSVTVSVDLRVRNDRGGTLK